MTNRDAKVCRFECQVYPESDAHPCPPYEGPRRPADLAMLDHDLPEGLDGKIRPQIPAYMTHAHTGMDMGKMAEVMPYPPNTISMKGATGPYGDPAWYQHPSAGPRARRGGHGHSR